MDGANIYCDIHDRGKNRYKRKGRKKDLVELADMVATYTLMKHLIQA